MRWIMDNLEKLLKTMPLPSPFLTQAKSKQKVCPFWEWNKGSLIQYFNQKINNK